MQNPTIGIIGGKGRLGSHFANFFREREVPVIISDVDTKLTNTDLAQKADIIIISVPIDITEKVISDLRPHLRKDTAIMDFTSVKERPVKAMLKANCEVLGMHPMFGDANRIPGQTIIFCPTKKTGKYSEWIETFFRNNGVNIVKMRAKDHDKMMNVAQGLIHFSDLAFIDALRRMKIPIRELLNFTGKPSELKIQLAGRLIAQDPNLYANIQLFNKYNQQSLKALSSSYNELLKTVKTADRAKFLKTFQKNKDYLGTYQKEALNDSSFLIDKFIEKKRAISFPKDNFKPTKQHIALLGPAGTFSEIAADNFLQENHIKLKKYFAKDIEEVCEITAAGKVKMGLIPLENRYQGTVRETFDGLFKKNIHITDKINVGIHHSLLMLPFSDPKKIKVIISHPQALSQCKNYLRKNFPNAEYRPAPSTTHAIEELIISNNSGTAVIANKSTAKYGLQIHAENIEDQKDNTTSFVVIQKGEISPKPAKGQTTMIAFYFEKDAPGSLNQIFNEFAKAAINLTRIESRPSQKEHGNFIFYMDFNGNPSQKNIKTTLNKIEKLVSELKILGVY